MGEANLNPLHEQVAVVTGAGRGIGAAIARKLAGLGAVVILCGRKREPLESTAGEIRRDDGQAEVLPCDVTDLSSVEAAAQHIDKTHGRADILVNNAGIGGFGGPLHKMLQPDDVAHIVGMLVTQAPQSFASEILLRPTMKP